MEGSVNSKGVGEAGGVPEEMDVVVEITGRGVFVGMIITAGDMVGSRVGVAGAPHAERVSNNTAIAIKFFFIFTISLCFVTANTRAKFHLTKNHYKFHEETPTVYVHGLAPRAGAVVDNA
jgi:hypothetical protein